MRFAFAVGAFVLVAGLGACTAPDPAPSVPSRPPGAVDAAIARTEAAATFRYTVTVVASGADRPVSVQASGVFDRDQGAFTLATDLSTIQPDLGGPMTIVATPTLLYVDCPPLVRLLGAPTRWISVEGSSAEAIRASVVDPTQVLELARRADPSMPSSGVSVDVTVGDDGLVRRVCVRFDAADRGSAAVLSAEFFDVGSPVEVRTPAPDEVTDETDALNRLFGGSTGG